MLPLCGMAQTLQQSWTGWNQRPFILSTLPTILIHDNNPAFATYFDYSLLSILPNESHNPEGCIQVVPFLFDEEYSPMRADLPFAHQLQSWVLGR